MKKVSRNSNSLSTFYSWQMKSLKMTKQIIAENYTYHFRFQLIKVSNHCSTEWLITSTPPPATHTNTPQLKITNQAIVPSYNTWVLEMETENAAKFKFCLPVNEYNLLKWYKYSTSEKRGLIQYSNLSHLILYQYYTPTVTYSKSYLASALLIFSEGRCTLVLVI